MADQKVFIVYRPEVYLQQLIVPATSKEEAQEKAMRDEKGIVLGEICYSHIVDDEPWRVYPQSTYRKEEKHYVQP